MLKVSFTNKGILIKKKKILTKLYSVQITVYKVGGSFRRSSFLLATCSFTNSFTYFQWSCPPELHPTTILLYLIFLPCLYVQSPSLPFFFFLSQASNVHVTPGGTHFSGTAMRPGLQSNLIKAEQCT